ncbi:transcriptional regulator [Paraburkholderia sp. BR10936]|uniref:transcriptional regulator n=1 Tax=Paraburkholderia sp. BR10936 TaxID=3236993 RepID=UPI0034D2F8E6
MKQLLDFINSMTPENQKAFAARIGTSVGYLRKAISAKQTFGAGLCVNIERESGGAIPCEVLDPSVDWAYLRSTFKQAA